MKYHYRLAPMTLDVLVLTVILLLIPVAIQVWVLVVSLSLLVPLLFIYGIYAWDWLRFRPSRFVIDEDALEVVWPLKRRRIRRADIEDVRLTDRRALRRELGWGFRVGAGGLGGAFGWLWTQRRGPVQMYVSRNRDLVWIEMGDARPWLITPERPGEFIQRLSTERSAEERM
ncbi:PH domain-containing protein [Thiohalocapsa marina]|nr:PH domain-containing protein [Thiohalocapsa marina]